MTQSFRTCLFHRAIESRTQYPNFDEVIEMTSLQRSVLPIVGEAQHFRG
jgi:hypothetical protein